MKKLIPDLMILSDLHIRSTSPVCRGDDMLDVIKGKLEFIDKIWGGFGYVPYLIIAGDVFHKPIQSPEVLNLLVDILTPNDEWKEVREIFVIPGQHDLPSHSLSLLSKSALGVMSHFWKVCDRIEVWGINGVSCLFVPFGISLDSQYIQKTHDGGKANVMVIHQYIHKGRKSPWPGWEGLTDKQLQKKFPNFDLIICGDNHKQFITPGKPIILNPGPLIRQTVVEKDHQPKIFLYYHKTRNVTPIDIPIDKQAVLDFHLTQPQELSSKVDLFIKRLKDTQITSDFKHNLLRAMRQDKMNPGVKKVIRRALAECQK